MKKRLPGLAALACIIFCTTLLQGQYVEEPIRNIYKLGGSAELFLSYSTAGNTFSKIGVLDVPENLNNIVKMEDAHQQKFIDIRKTASACGDFNGDGKEEVVTICDNISGGIKITIPLVDEDLLIDGVREFTLEELNDLPYERVRICAGNFDRDRQDEFVICYGLAGETIRVVLLETDEDLNISALDTYKEISFFDVFFDITAGDVDGDGIDEMVMVKNEALPFETDAGVNPPVFTSTYDLYILKYDYDTEEIVEIENANNIELSNQASTGEYRSSVRINEMRVACGDLNIDGKDEIVVAWSNFYCSHRTKVYDDIFHITYHWEYKYREMLFLNTFNFNQISSEIESVQNLQLADNYYGTYSGYPDQHIALSLKCKKLDNLGRDEVLVNGSSKLIVLGSADDGMGLEKRAEIIGKGGNLNTSGNEAFIVTDLNPDTADMNFNKELVLLLSNKDFIDQLKKSGDVTSFEILLLDTISADTVAFSEPGPPYALPFEDADIEIAGFTVADFDLKNSDVYHIGVPDVIPVSDLQYPLVILNAPPVHFDVLDGVSHDLCDAFLIDDTPTFSAVYVTKIEDQLSTKIEVDNSFGFSTDFRSYAMAGGTGFESSVQTNWNSGKSYYQAKSHSKDIEETKEVYTEDYVLYSSLDYTYYRYPIYDDDGKMIGRIAVLNPESSEFKSSWGSGNSWEHPGYVFNHEPGNLFSYRPYMSTSDFCTGNPDFSFCEFTSVPVTNSGNGSFEFEFEDITDEGSSYSFSGGVGADMFTKVGAEGTATVELAPFGLGGSISTDFRVGVSSELSTYYSQSSLTTHNTQLTNSFRIEGNIGRLNENYDNTARYNITPFIYRSQSGALILDYMVEFDQDNKDWWEANYGVNPDLAFILPWRYAEEKGSNNVAPSKKQKTTDIQFYPAIVSKGDTVCITARVHNYSLKTFDGELKVSYFIGDPANGGIELSDINGTMGKSKFSSMIYGASEASMDIDEYLSFNWKVPDTITCSPRIYVRIDPENEVMEIHEDNNKGWNLLHVLDCYNCSYVETAIEPNCANYAELEIYPRPATNFSNISFSLPRSSDVKVNLYSLSGQELMTIEDALYPAGKHVIRHDVSQLPGGLYFYHFSADGMSTSAKLLIVR